MNFPSFKHETQSKQEGYLFVAGCDEVGVGPLAGPVVAGCCILNADSIGKYRSKTKWYYRVRDSKTISEKERERLAEEIKSHCVAYGVGEVSPDMIDKINIHQATLLAMKLAIENVFSKLDPKVNAKAIVYIDGRFAVKELNCPQFCMEQKTIVKGDTSVLSISAASIIAKVHRDGILKKLHEQFPHYGFINHKGYNTAEHRSAIEKNGITIHHRKSFLKNFVLQPN